MQNFPERNLAQLSIILPVLGKGVCLEGVLKLLTIDVTVPYEILFVCRRNDIDPSIIERVCQKYPTAHWLERDQSAGTLAALRQGIEASVGEYILVVCADTAGPVTAVNQMLNLVRDGCDFVNGTRYAGGGRRLGGPIIEVSLSRIANYFLCSLAGCVFTDATTGLKLFRKSVFKQLFLQSNSMGWVVAFEMSLKAQLTGLKVGEVANIAIDRLFGGDSTCQFDREFLQYLYWFFWSFLNLRRASMKQLTVPVSPIKLAD